MEMEIIEMGEFDGVVLVNGDTVKFSVEGGLLSVRLPSPSDALPGEVRDFLRKDQGVLSAMIYATSYF